MGSSTEAGGMIQHKDNHFMLKDANKEVPKGQFNPYQNNEGTVLAITGTDFCIAACDTRISNGYSILSRNHSKTTKLTDNCVLTSAGMVADVDELHRVLEIKLRQFRMNNRGRNPPVESIANLLGNSLYSR